MPKSPYEREGEPRWFWKYYGLPEPEPEPPQPAPFPIRIISDPPPVEEPKPAEVKPKSDYFYIAWDKFLAQQPTRAKRINKTAKNLEQEKDKVKNEQPEGLHTEKNAAKSWEDAASMCREKVNAIIEECKRLNQKYRDALFDLEQSPYCLSGLTGRVPSAVRDTQEPPWIKRVEDIFDNPQFYIDGATAEDIHQGNAGDCWFLAALMAVTAKKDLIERLCVARDEKVGVYGFVFYRDGEWMYEVIDDKLYMRVGDDDDLDIVRDWSKSRKEGVRINHDEDKLKETLQKGGEALYFSHCKSSETWLPLIEKAYAKAHGDYSAIEGGFPSEGIEDLTGGVATVINPEDIMDKDKFWKEQLLQVNQKYLFGGGTRTKTGKGVIGGHAYAVLQAWEEGDLRLLKLKNPWSETEWEGDWSDGSKQWTPDMMQKLNHTFGNDGIFWMSYKDFFKHFPSINRVRLFDEQWQVTQRWTCVNVPWTVDYLDTRFELTVAEKTPIVIVLSQPDDRYFYGLRGRYLYSLHFRLYRQNEKGQKYLVRSMHNSGNETIFTRSVSAELEDVEPGKYYVLFKITATRTDQQSAEEAVLQYSTVRKKKLLEVGQRFDYAQTKGNLRVLEKSTRKEQRGVAWDKAVATMRRNRRFNKLERERAARRKKRIEDAMNEKRKAIHNLLVGRAKEQKAKKAAKKASRVSVDSLAANVSDEGKMTPAATDSAAEVIESKPDTQDVTAVLAKLEISSADENKSDESIAAGAEVAAAKPESKTADETATPDTNAIAEHSSSADAESTPTKSTESKDEATDEPQSDAKITESESKGTQVSRSEVSQPDEESSSEDDEWEAPPESVDDLEDNDFSWDDDMDGPVNSDTSSRSTTTGKDLTIFGDDEWCALCTIGLRVYTKCKVDINVRTTHDDEEELEEEV